MSSISSISAYVQQGVFQAMLSLPSFQNYKFDPISFFLGLSLSIVHSILRFHIMVSRRLQASPSWQKHAPEIQGITVQQEGVQCVSNNEEANNRCPFHFPFCSYLDRCLMKCVQVLVRPIFGVLQWHNHHIMAREGYNIPLLLLLSHFSPVQLCVTPQMAVHQAPPSLGFSRQEQWSRLPFPSPVRESEK